MIPTLISQSRLSIAELDNFLSQFIATFDKYTADEVPASPNAAIEINPNDINLKNKQDTLRLLLEKYEISIKRSKKASETISMTELDTWRMKQMANCILHIRSFRTDDDLDKRNASLLYEPLLDQFKNLYSLTNSAQTAIIEKFIASIQTEKYKPAYDILGLAARITSLKKTNDDYKQKSLERANEEKNRNESPSDCRQKCIVGYRNLVSLINFAEEINKSLLYAEMINELSAQTIVVQELINRRANAAKKKKEGETTPKTQDVEPEDSEKEFIQVLSQD